MDDVCTMLAWEIALKEAGFEQCDFWVGVKNVHKAVVDVEFLV